MRGVANGSQSLTTQNLTVCESKVELKLKISSAIVKDLEGLKQLARERSLSLELDESVEQHLKKIIKKAKEELAKFDNQ